MFPLWQVAIAPVLAAARAKRVVEIGALRGETTTQMLEFLGPDAELHVIDPVPEFDPTEHEQAFPGRYVFHRDLSHNVLPTLGPLDAALIDGDHNWYTVHGELTMLAEGARRAGTPLPVLVMHDVGWPYGRRDLYYAPEQIPTEFRQPYRQAGMRPGRKELLSSGGLNPTMYNAELEGGERNGVMTALDDFVREYDRPLRRLVLPIYFGLAVVVEEAWLERRPELAAALDRLESAEGRYELLKVAEDVRLRAMIFQHNVFYRSQAQVERGATRYLEVVKAALLDEHYLENEARLAHVTRSLAQGRPLDPERLRDPARYDQEEYARLLRQRRAGIALTGDARTTTFLPYAAMGRIRLDHLEACLDMVRRESVAGDLAECGTGRGGGAMFLRAYLDAYELAERTVWVADRFRASQEPELAPSLPPAGAAALQPDLNLVRDGFARFDLLDDRVRFLQGPMDATIPGAAIERLALLRIGEGLGDGAGAVLDHLYDKLSIGGFVIVDDRDDPASRKAVDAFRLERGITAPLERVDWSAVAWRKLEHEASAPRRRASAPSARPAGPPLVPKAPPDALDLSVLVVFYDMRREAARTLESLSRSYQEGIADIGYEVIAIDNGSHEHEKLDPAFVESFGPEFRYLDLGREATASPVGALNHALRSARGRNVALMIDGAHVLTPGVLRFGLAGLGTYDPAIVATQQWYVGPGQQGDAMDDGYDEAYEDRLFREIGWPTAGYRLFEIGHFVGDRDWLDGVWESNCIFVPRRLLEQVGGFDESFSMPGGGYANLEVYERLGSSPGVTVASILGEGSFHQLHGGTTTNQPDAAERRARVFGYSEHYAGLRGRRFKGPGKPIHYVGRIASSAARRTKPRRMTAETFARGADVPAPDGRPSAPTPVPDDLRSAFTEAVWRSLPWERTTWLGRRVTTAPTDLLAYQELVAAVRPDWVVETGTGDGGRALFLASICELVEHGRVLSIGQPQDEDLPGHPRLRYLAGKPQDPATVAAARDAIGDGRCLVVLGSCVDRHRTSLEFEAYAPLVPVGSYVVVTDTIVNGRPVWPAFGPGPGEAVKQILTLHGEFVADPAMEKYSLTFNPGGFLKRVR